MENLLLTTGGAIKLCDFGSATMEQISPDHSWTATQRGLADDEVLYRYTYTIVSIRETRIKLLVF